MIKIIQQIMEFGSFKETAFKEFVKKMRFNYYKTLNNSVQTILTLPLIAANIQISHHIN